MFYLTEDQVKEFLKNIPGERDRLIYEVFLSTGMRLAEVCSLNIEQISEKFQIIGKGGKPRTIFLTPEMVGKIKNFVGRSTKGPLFTSNRKGRISRKTIQYHSKRYLKGIGIDEKKFGTHSLRHSFLTRVYQNTKDLRLCQELAGHSSPTVTAIYTHVPDSDKVSAIKNLW